MNKDPITIVVGAERTLPAVVARAVARWGDRSFLLADEDGRPGATFATFAADVDAVGAGMLAAGVVPGEPVGVLAPNGNNALVAVFALIRIGAVPTMASPSTRRSLGSPRWTRVIAPASWSASLPAEMAWFDVDALPRGDGVMAAASAEPSEVAMVLPTSGTTGATKGVQLSHTFCVRYAETGVWMRRLDASDGIYGFTPLFHSDGILANSLAALLVGARLHLAGPPSPARFWRRCRDRELTTFSYAGGLIGALAAVPEHADDGDNPVRVAYGAPSPPGRARAFEARFGLHLAEAYGSTEVGIPVVAPWDCSRVEEGSCGRVLPGYDIQVCDDGELLVRPPDPHFVMEGYVGDPDATHQRLPGDGWFHTGDLLADIGDGHLAFRGRKGQAIRTKGEFVPLVLIEQAAEDDDEIVEAAAYGVASPSGEPGEELVALAVIVLDPRSFDPDALRRRLARTVSPGFVPTRVEVLDELPRSPGTGKVQKHLLPGTPLGAVWAWAEAWRQLDAVSLQRLFDPAARYSSARLGPLEQVHRQLRIGARMWVACAIDDLAVAPIADAGTSDRAAAGATYRFEGTDRDGAHVQYHAAARFELARREGEWRIVAFAEQYAPEERDRLSV
ncbi:MAG: AMP-binding protein [Acidimicrobiales bacterium]